MPVFTIKKTWKTKKYLIVEKVPNSNRRIAERGVINRYL